MQEKVLIEDWTEIKRPFRFANVAVSVAGMLLPAKKGRWLPLVFSGYKIVSSFLKSSKKK